MSILLCAWRGRGGSCGTVTCWDQNSSEQCVGLCPVEQQELSLRSALVASVGCPGQHCTAAGCQGSFATGSQTIPAGFEGPQIPAASQQGRLQAGLFFLVGPKTSKCFLTAGSLRPFPIWAFPSETPCLGTVVLGLNQQIWGKRKSSASLNSALVGVVQVENLALPTTLTFWFFSSASYCAFLHTPAKAICLYHVTQVQSFTR